MAQRVEQWLCAKGTHDLVKVAEGAKSERHVQLLYCNKRKYLHCRRRNQAAGMDKSSIQSYGLFCIVADCLASLAVR